MVRKISRLLLAAVVVVGMAGCVPVAPVADEPAEQDVDADVECRSNVDCDDGLFCNGRERCRGVRCEDGDRPCGNGACNEARNRCEADEPEPECVSNADCQDGIFCNGFERCIQGTCLASNPPCGNGLCDEARDICAPPPLDCGAGYQPAANNSEVCCPVGFPFIAEDELCYISQSRANSADRMYSACGDFGWTHEDTDVAVLQIYGFQQEGDSLNDVLLVVGMTCGDICPGDPACNEDCLRCSSAVAAFVYGL